MGSPVACPSPGTKVTRKGTRLKSTRVWRWERSKGKQTMAEIGAVRPQPTRKWSPNGPCADVDYR
jgi:hypothetical protein